MSEFQFRPLTWDLPTVEGCKECDSLVGHRDNALYGMDAECVQLELLEHLCHVHHMQDCSRCWDTECGDNTNHVIKEVKERLFNES